MLLTVAWPISTLQKSWENTQTHDICLSLKTHVVPTWVLKNITVVLHISRAPSQQAMQLMLNSVEDFAKRLNISFSTDPNPHKSKSKCIHVVDKRRSLKKPAPLTLCGHNLPWVQSAVHLGHELHESGLMDHDSVVERTQFVEKSVEVRNICFTGQLLQMYWYWQLWKRTAAPYMGQSCGI